MHEVDMTRALVLSMQSWREGHRPQQPKVSRVNLQVGAFTCVEPEQLLFTWQVAIANSWLEGAQLAIEPVPLQGRCLACASIYTPEAEQGYRSPCCSQPMEEIVSGRELRIRSVDYELVEANPPPNPRPFNPVFCS